LKTYNVRYKHLLNALELHGRRLPLGGVSARISLWGESLAHTFHVFNKTSKTQDNSDLLELSQLYMILTQLFEGAAKNVPAAYSCLAALNLAETIGNKKIMAISMAHLANIYFAMGSGSGAVRTLEHALAFAKEVRDPTCTLVVHEQTGLYYQSIGAWEESLKAFSKLLKTSLKYGSKHYYDAAVNHLASWNCAKGNFAKQFKFAKEAYDSTSRRGDLLRPLAACNYAQALVMYDSLEDALQLIDQEKKRLQVDAVGSNTLADVTFTSLLAVAYAYSKDIPAALKHMQDAMEAIRKLDDFTVRTLSSCVTRSDVTSLAKFVTCLLLSNILSSHWVECRLY
jgi:tetratricopeptide (TPR) repeat protein